MRILHLAERLTDRGGAHTWTAGVLDALATDHEQALVVGNDDGAPRPRCRVDVRPGLDARTGEPFSIADLVEGFRPDVVHVHNVMNPGVLEWAVGHGHALLTVQDHRLFCPGRGKWTLSGERCLRPLSREACASCFEETAYHREVQALTERRLAAARRLPVTVLSRYMREELIAAGVAPLRVCVVPPFVERPEPAPTPDGPPCVLFVGRLVEAKGVRDAVSAWRQSGVGLPLVLAGTGPLRAELERLAAEGEAVEVLGWVGRERLPAVYARARALVMPPRWQEPFGIAGLEALAHGVPVVAWESGGIGEWHPGPGLVRWGDVPALAGALRSAVDRRVTLPPRFERGEAVGRLVCLYARAARAGAGDPTPSSSALPSWTARSTSCRPSR
jgi:glycosyltransferase involved in cell wall biosynthesis